jgi:hypothetical protein
MKRKNTSTINFLSLFKKSVDISNCRIGFAFMIKGQACEAHRECRPDQHPM